MRTIVNSITRWDILWSTAIFGLHGQRLVNFLMPRISWTGNGYCYPLLAALLLAVEPAVGRVFLNGGHCGLFDRASRLQTHQAVRETRPAMRNPARG